MKKIHWFTLTNIPTSFIQGDSFEITDKEVQKQILRVLKLHVGEHIIIKDDGFGYECELTEVSHSTVKISLLDKLEKSSQKSISLFFCIPKKDKFELILEKCTEIGVTDFYPIISDRTVKTNINTERSVKIIQEASEQAQRIDTPTLHAIQSIDDIVKEYRPAVFDVEGENFKRDENKAIHNILIGPEGGFTLRELELFKNNRLDIYKIGDTVLKTETAAIVASALLLQ